MPTLASISLAALTMFQSASCPDTPQYRAVLEYIETFNHGTEDAVVKLLEKYASSDALKRRTPEQRSESYRRIKETFGTLKIARAVTCSAAQIVVSIKRLDGTEAWWAFEFDAGDEVRFAGISLTRPEPRWQ